MPLQNRVTPSRRHHRDTASRPVHRQSRHHSRPRHQDADAALGRQGLDHLRLRIPRPPPRGDGRAQLDRAVLSRRGDRVRGGASAVLLLPPRRCEPVSRGVATGQWRHGYSRARHRRGAASTNGWRAEPSDCTSSRLRSNGCRTARWSRLAMKAYLIVQGRALLWSPAGYRRARSALQAAMLLTPPSTLRAFSAGYRPVLHPSVTERAA